MQKGIESPSIVIHTNVPYYALCSISIILELCISGFVKCQRGPCRTRNY